MRGAAKIAVVLATVLAAACGGSATGVGTPSEGDGAGGGPSAAAGSCSGAATECYKIGTIASCFRQRGCKQVTDDCSGKQVACGLIGDKGGCLEQIGCFWLEPSGEKVSPPGGSCTGAVVACTSYADEVACDRQNGRCNWVASKSKCERDYSVDGDCSAYNRLVVRPEEAKSVCEGREGCTWVPTP